MKIVLRYARALNTGWLPTYPPHVNDRFSCKSDLGAVGIHSGTDFPASGFFELTHGQSYSVVINPIIIRSNENIKSVDPKL